MSKKNHYKKDKLTLGEAKGNKKINKQFYIFQYLCSVVLVLFVLHVVLTFLRTTYSLRPSQLWLCLVICCFHDK